MLEGSETLFIPLTDAHVAELVGLELRYGGALSSYSIAEAAATFVVQNIPGFEKHHRTAQYVESRLAEAIKMGTDIDKKDTGGAFSQAIAQRFDLDSFRSGASLLTTLNIRLLDFDSLARKDYLLDSGLWDFGFSKRHAQVLNPFTDVVDVALGRTIALTLQQARAFSEFLTDVKEHVHIQALAGTGKTYLIGKMVESLVSYRPLVLAFTWSQLNPLIERLSNNKIEGVTYGQLAAGLLRYTHNESSVRRAHRSRLSYQVSYEEVARRLNFLSVGELNPIIVALNCNSMVKSFCSDCGSVITRRHIPKQFIKLSVLDEDVLVQYATKLWEQTIEPTDPSLQLPLRGYHLIKKLSLMKSIKISAKYTHVIVDESHDLSAPLIQFLDRCEQSVITMGDSCQRIDGRVSTRGEHVRHREVYHSIRAGRQIEAIINPLIDNNPFVKVHPLEGSKGHDTQIVFYEKSELPDCPCTILVNSEWGMFEWFQRLGSQNAKFDILAVSKQRFNEFARECINFYHGVGDHPSHGALFWVR